MPNRLFYGDNLNFLRESIADESVDLIYLDPPLNSNASCKALFKAPSGEKSASAGFYATCAKKFPGIQVFTAEQIIDGARPQAPFGFTESLKSARRETEDRQEKLI
jgi:DNA modification methylase